MVARTRAAGNGKDKKSSSFHEKKYGRKLVRYLLSQIPVLQIIRSMKSNGMMPRTTKSPTTSTIKAAGTTMTNNKSWLLFPFPKRAAVLLLFTSLFAATAAQQPREVIGSSRSRRVQRFDNDRLPLQEGTDDVYEVKIVGGDESERGEFPYFGKTRRHDRRKREEEMKQTNAIQDLFY